MLDKNYVMKYLIDYEKSHRGQYASLADPIFYGKRSQFKLIELCQTLVTEEGLAEWEGGLSSSLNIRVTDHGKGYFIRKRNRFADRAIGFVFGVATTVVANCIIRLI